MRRLPLVALALLSLFLAADNVRLRVRPRAPEPRPSPARRPAPDAAEEPSPEIRKPSTSPAAAAENSPPAPVERKRIEAAPALRAYAVRSLTARASNLNLTEAQKRLIDDLWKRRDAQAQVFRDQIAAIEAQTTEAIRQLLDPEQARLFDAQAGADVVVHAALAPTEAPPGPPSGYLGVGGSDAEGGGAAVGEVFPDTAAFGAGLQPGDVVLEFNGRPVADWEGLAARIRELGPGTSVVLKLRRGDAVIQQGLQLGSR